MVFIVVDLVFCQVHFRLRGIQLTFYLNNIPFFESGGIKYALLFLLQLPAGEDYQEGAGGDAADFLEVAPELLSICLALLAKLFGVFGLVATALLAFVPEFLSHRGSPWRLDSNIHFLR